MDIASKLKALLWFFITGLWALFMYQYMAGDMYRSTFGTGKRPVYTSSTPSVSAYAAKKAEDRAALAAQMQENAKNAEYQEKFQNNQQESSPVLASIPKAKIKSKTQSDVLFSSTSAYDFNVPVSTAFANGNLQQISVSDSINKKEQGVLNVSIPEDLKNPPPNVPGNRLDGKNSITSEAKQHKVKPLEKEITPSDYPAVPSGFQQKVTRHFVIYEEGEVSEDLVKKAEGIHGSIMLDLADFSPWSREKKVFIFYAHSQSSYQKISGRPAWSGGAASLDARSIYLYKTKGSYGILAHELTHMYFDSFFPPEHPSPLWLSEGMAMFVQIERANSSPVWFNGKFHEVKNGNGYDFNLLLTVDDLDGADEDNIRLWYAQAYSLTKYLMTVKGSKAFYSFCKYLKSGFSIEQSVSMAYSQNIKTLEFNWRSNLSQQSFSSR